MYLSISVQFSIVTEIIRKNQVNYNTNSLYYLLIIPLRKGSSEANVLRVFAGYRYIT